MKAANDHKNFLIRGVVSGGWEVRFIYCGCTNAVNGIINAQNADPAGAEILADAVSAACALRTTLEEGERETFRWRYDGAIGNVITEISADGKVRALAGNPRPMSVLQQVNLDNLLCENAVTISVIRQAKNGMILANGTTETMLRGPAESLGYYLSVSEQVESIILTGLEWAKDGNGPVEWAGSLILQALPGCDVEKFVAACSEESLPIPAGDQQPEEVIKSLLSRIFANAPITIHTEPAPVFKCSCSRDRFIAALKTLGRKDREELASGKKYISMSCEFCGRVCRIKPEEFI